MPKLPISTIADAQIGRALRRVLAESRGYELVRLADADAPPYALVRQEDSRAPATYTADDAVIAAGSLELLIETLLEEELETGRDLAIDELFDDEAHGFNLSGISLGTLAAAMHFAPGAPIQRELLYAVNAHAAPHGELDGEGEDGQGEDDEGDARLAALRHRFPRPGLLLADACVEHLLEEACSSRSPTAP
jgi:hypothetical protein